MEKILWEHVRGSIDSDGISTTFRLAVWTGDGHWAQAITVETDRLRRHPELYKSTLDMMVRDIEARL